MIPSSLHITVYIWGLLHTKIYRRKLWLKLKTRVSTILPLTLTQEKTQVKNNLSFLRLRVLCNRPLKLWSKVSQIFLLFSLYFGSLNLKYLKIDQNGYNPFCDEILHVSFTLISSMNVYIHFHEHQSGVTASPHIQTSLCDTLHKAVAYHAASFSASILMQQALALPPPPHLPSHISFFSNEYSIAIRMAHVFAWQN